MSFCLCKEFSVLVILWSHIIILYCLPPQGLACYTPLCKPQTTFNQPCLVEWSKPTTTSPLGKEEEGREVLSLGYRESQLWIQLTIQRFVINDGVPVMVPIDPVWWGVWLLWTQRGRKWQTIGNTWMSLQYLDTWLKKRMGEVVLN